MTISDELSLQFMHTHLVAKLIMWAGTQDINLTWGEAYRTAEQAQWDCQHHTGISASLHCDRLAVDLQAFDVNGNYLTDKSAYQPLGDYWKSLDPRCRWGGDFTTVDADHFSITFQGRS
jgi:hypothetical protein